MKLRTIFLIAALASLLGIRAQELTVKAMKATNDLSASQYRRLDRNGKPCGLVKVQLATTGATFEGNVIKPVEYKTGEYWVYMTEGSREVRVKHPSFVPLHVTFSDYGVKAIQSLTTYDLTLLMPQGGGGNVDDGMRYLAMTVEPKEAMVYIDDQPQMLQNGTLSILLPMGQHSYRVESPPAYETKRGTFTIGEETLQLPVRLESLMASLGVTATTAGTQIYVNDQLRGTSSWTGSLAAGTYRIEGRLDGYRSHRQTVTLSQRDRQQLTIPALQAIVGNLNVNYQPLNAEVWLDGKKTGTSPNVFRNIQVGSHEVEIRANGHQSKKETVTIEEGKTAMLMGSLEQQQIVQSQSHVQTVASSASGGQIETFTVKGVSFTMVRVDGGELMIGNTKEQDSVSERGTFSQAKKSQKAKLFSFMIGETEVTQALWKAIMGNKNPISDNDYSIPVDSVTWNDCQEFISKLNKLTGKKFRLPTEDEWEYAARGGNKSKHFKYSGSNVLNDVAWNEHNSGKTIHPIKTRKPNELNIYDMSGNVWEWCADILDWSHNQTQPPGNLRAYRGGSCTPYSSGCQVSSRVFAYPKETYRHVGFRLAL